VHLLSLGDHLAEQLLELEPTDLLVVFEPRRATRALVRLIEQVRLLGAAVAAFTDDRPPAVIAASDVLVRTKVDAVSTHSTPICRAGTPATHRSREPGDECRAAEPGSRTRPSLGALASADYSPGKAVSSPLWPGPRGKTGQISTTRSSATT
jgi:hypothetical protein